MYLFDTDHLTFLQRREGAPFENLLNRIGQLSQSSFFVPVVAFHEQVLGWHNFIAKDQDGLRLVVGYQKFEELFTAFASYQIRSFDAAAADVYEDLRSRRIRVGAMDLRIGAIAISGGLTLLTRNAVDFERIPNLQFEDWTR